MKKNIDIYKDYRADQYIHYRQKVVRYEEQAVKGRQKKRVIPVMESYEISFDEIKTLRLDDNGSPVPTHDTEDFTIVSNYLLDFWGAVMGSESVMTYLHLRRYAYGKKDYCFPNLKIIEEKMNRSRQVVKKYLQTLEEYGFAYQILRRDKNNENRDASPLFKIRRYIPMLTKEMYDQLPTSLQKKHDDYMAQYNDLGFTQAFDKGHLVIDDLLEGAKRLKSKKQKESEQKHQEELEEIEVQNEVILTNMTQLQREMNRTFHEYFTKIVSKPSYDTFFKMSLYFMMDDESHILLLPNMLSKNWVETQYERPIEQFLQDNFHTPPELTYELIEDFLAEVLSSR